MEDYKVNYKGLTIYGQLYKPLDFDKKSQYPTVILSHGFGSNHETLTDTAVVLAENGFVAYAYDFCGGGAKSRSSLSFEEMSVLTEYADLEAVLAHFEKLSWVDEKSLFLLGKSQGGFVSAHVAANYPEKVAGLVLYYPAFVLQDDAKERMAKTDYAPNNDYVMGIKLGEKYSSDAVSFDIYDVIPAYKGPVLIIHGDKDPIVPLSYSERAQQVYENAELVVIPEAGHGFTKDEGKLADRKSSAFFRKNSKRC
ncbi:alpha/beta hydrolase family protein [Streptococcus dentiloxodontae]